jgi:hypothetical protein
MTAPSHRRFGLLALAALLAAGCAAPMEKQPEPPWLVPSQNPADRRTDARDANSANEKTISVEAEGEGITEDAAKQDALRNALERGAGVIVRNESLAVDWQLARDVVLTETRGSIRSFDVLSQTRNQGAHVVRIRAVVSTKMIGRDLSILHYLSNHARVACSIVDIVSDRPVATTLAKTSVERALLAKKFTLVDSEQVAAVAARERLAGFADPQRARKLGEKWGCDIVITGRSSVAPAGERDIYGVHQQFYSANIEARAVLVSSGQVIASESVTTHRGATSGMAAQKRALAGAGEDLAEELIRKLVLHLRSTSLDRDRIELRVGGVDFPTLMALEAALEKVTGVHKVIQRSFQGDTAEIECRYRGDARTLARTLATLKSPALEMQSVDRNRIVARVKK